MIYIDPIWIRRRRLQLDIWHNPSQRLRTIGIRRRADYEWICSTCQIPYANHIDHCWRCGNAKP